MDGLTVNAERKTVRERIRVMYKSRQRIITIGEYDLPCPNDSPPASEPCPWGDKDRKTGEGWRVSRVALRQTYSRRAEID
jgi:hypothetical protein